MGVAELPPTPSEHNVNFGDKDSIRRRALWALEGKTNVSFGQVEIPELTTPDVEKPAFDFSSKSGFSGGTSAPFGNSLMGSKRDSFKLLPPSGSSKDALHTLVEEEEEEEEEEDSPLRNGAPTSLPTPVSADEDVMISAPDMPAPIAPTQPALGKPRPTSLNLRPLSLVAETLAVQGLPTPTLSPSPRSALRFLSPSPISSNEDSTKEVKQSRRNSFTFVSRRRSPLNDKSSSIDSTTSSSDEGKPRRSSISYKTSGHVHVNSAGLPTPEMTPTFKRRTSLSESTNGGEEEFFLGSQGQPSCKPLSASEQHFLLKSHNALVARITDLERALSKRTSVSAFSSDSRPGSITSDTTSSEGGLIPGEPSDELLYFIRDLKAERDELKRDVDGWRTRVADLDRKHALLAKRVEAERWEAWAARSRVGILEAEKAALEKRVQALDQSFAQFDSENDRLVSENRELKLDNEAKATRIQVLEAELELVKGELEQERAAHRHQLAAFNSTGARTDPLATPTPETFAIRSPSSMPPAYQLGFGIEDEDHIKPFGFGFASPPERDEDFSPDDGSGLAGYEDDDDEFETSSSYGSLNELTQRPSTNDSSALFGPAPVRPVVPPRPAEPLRDSLSFNWSFPRTQSQHPIPAAPVHDKHQPVDRFFNCLDESDASDDSAPASPLSLNYEQSKDMFASGFQFIADDESPFYLPPGVGIVVEEDMDMKNGRVLTTVDEVEEDDETGEDDSSEGGDMFGNKIGIMITLTPADDTNEHSEEVPQTPTEVPQIPVASMPEPVPMAFHPPDLNSGFVDEEAGPRFTFGVSPSTLHCASPPSRPVSLPSTSPALSPRASPLKSSSPSSIPRPISRPSDRTPPTPPKNPKRIVSSPSLIPQRVASPTSVRIAPWSSSPKNGSSAPSFIRPPNRRTQVNKNSASRNSHERAPMTAYDSLYRTSDHNARIPADDRPSENSAQVTMESVDLRHDSSLYSNLFPANGHNAMSPQPSTEAPTSLTSFITAPLSTGMLSNVLPWSWSSRPSVPPSNSQISSPSSRPRKASFISREKQLAKLKSRLAHEGVGDVVCHCRRCDHSTLVML